MRMMTKFFSLVTVLGLSASAHGASANIDGVFACRGIRFATVELLSLRISNQASAVQIKSNQPGASKIDSALKDGSKDRVHPTASELGAGYYYGQYSDHSTFVLTTWKVSDDGLLLTIGDGGMPSPSLDAASPLTSLTFKPQFFCQKTAD